MSWARNLPAPCRSERSAGLPKASPFSRAFCPNRSRFGQNAGENWPENARRSHLGRCMSAGTPPRGLAVHCECPLPQPAKRHSVRQTAARTGPADLQPAVSRPWRYNNGPGPSRSPGSNDRLFPQPSAFGVLFLLASLSGTLSLASTHLPNTEAPTVSHGPSDNPRSEIKLRAQNEVMHVLWRPISPKDGGTGPAAI